MKQIENCWNASNYWKYDKKGRQVCWSIKAKKWIWMVERVCARIWTIKSHNKWAFTIKSNMFNVYLKHFKQSYISFASLILYCSVCHMCEIWLFIYYVTFTQILSTKCLIWNAFTFSTVFNVLSIQIVVEVDGSVQFRKEVTFHCIDIIFSAQLFIQVNTQYIIE